MIYYFSGTGNSKWAAEQLAAIVHDTAVNLIDCLDPLIDNQIIGLVFPIYAWGAPEPVLEFVKRLKGKPTFAFGVCTCGDEAGRAMQKLSKVFHLNSAYSVAMPSNYVMGADVENAEIAASKIAKAKERLTAIAEEIKAMKSVEDVNQGSMPWIKSTLANVGFNRFARSTKPFYVTDACTSCGLCARNCPSKTIGMIDGKPSWGKKCYQCTACINLCPVKAIQYGKGTLNRGRYQFKELEVN